MTSETVVPAVAGEAQLPLPAYRLDLRGEPCPYPLMHTLDALAELAPGDVVEVLADCPQAFRTVPEEVEKLGHAQLRDPLRSGPEMNFLFQVGG